MRRRSRWGVTVSSLGVLLLAGGGACVGNEPQVGGAADAGASDTSADTSADAVVDTSADASVDTAADSDAGPACDVTKPFAPSQIVAGLSATASGTRLSADELTVYVTQAALPDSGMNAQLFVAVRATPAGAFGSALSVGAANSSTDDNFAPTVSADALTLISARSGPGYNSIFIATRTSTAAQFGSGSLLAGPVNTTGPLDYNGSPYLQPDGKLLFFTRGVSGLGGEIFQSAFSGGAFQTPTAVAELNTAAQETASVITSDALTVYWASQRTDLMAHGGYDIFMASRARATDAFSNLRNVAELNSASDESPSWVSADGCRLYFSGPGGTRVASHQR